MHLLFPVHLAQQHHVHDYHLVVERFHDVDTQFQLALSLIQKKYICICYYELCLLFSENVSMYIFYS